MDMPRVLLVTYYFPPSGGSGVQRMLKFTRYLRRHGWEPVVLTVEDGAYPEYDPTLMNDVPEGVEVRRTNSWNPFQWYARLMGKDSKNAVVVGSLGKEESGFRERLARWVRGNIFVPDARVGWLPYAVRGGQKLLDDLSIQAIVSSGPPHSTHLVARTLSRRSGVPWIADFRDPWTDMDYYNNLPMTRWAHRLNTHLEQSVLDEAAHLTTVSNSWCQLFGRKTTTPITLIRNGFDTADFDGISPVETKGTFMISHVGTMYTTRNPEMLWQVLGQLKSNGELPRLRLRFIGRVEPQVRETLQRYRLEKVTEYVSYVPHDKALAYMQGSTLLLLTINESSGPEFEGYIPGKFYEYLASRRPILAVGSQRVEVTNLLRETQSGQMVDYGDQETLKKLIRTYYARWEAGQPLEVDAQKDLTPYTREHQTGQLAKLLREVAA